MFFCWPALRLQFSANLSCTKDVSKATNCDAILMNFLMSCTRLQRDGHSSTSVITHSWTSLQRCSSSSRATVWPLLRSRLKMKQTSSCCNESSRHSGLMSIWFHSHFSKAVIGSFVGQTSRMESKMAQSKLVRATATSQVFKLSIRAVLCWSSELSVKGSYRGEKKNNLCPISLQTSQHLTECQKCRGF